MEVWSVPPVDPWYRFEDKKEQHGNRVYPIMLLTFEVQRPFKELILRGRQEVDSVAIIARVRGAVRRRGRGLDRNADNATQLGLPTLRDHQPPLHKDTSGFRDYEGISIQIAGTYIHTLPDLGPPRI